jgi:hypothetical protein
MFELLTLHGPSDTKFLDQSLDEVLEQAKRFIDEMMCLGAARHQRQDHRRLGKGLIHVEEGPTRAAEGVQNVQVEE